MAVIDFSIKVLSKSHEIYRSGSTKEQAEFAQIAQDFSDTSKELKSSIERKQTASHMQDTETKARLTMNTTIADGILMYAPLRHLWSLRRPVLP